MKTILLLFIFVFSLEASNKHILLLQSYNKGLKWSDDLSKGVEDILLKHKRYELTTEYMDSKKNSSKEYTEILYRLFLKKIQTQKYDVVIVADNFAIDFVIKYKKTLFLNTPIIFCGLDKDNPGIDLQKAIKKKVPTVLENKQVKTNINFIVNLLPKLEFLYIINDTTLSSKLINDKIKKAVNSLDKKIEYKIDLDGNINNIYNDYTRLPKNSAVLFGSLFTDKEGYYIPYYQVNDLINLSPFPVFSLTDSHLGNGVIGGLLSSGYSQGNEAAKIALKYLNEETIKSYNPVLANASWIFDYRILNKYHININSLPKESIIINQPKSFFQKYRDIIDIVFLIFPMVFVLLIISLINIVKRTKAEKRLIAQQSLSEVLLNNIESSIFWIDNDGNLKGCNNSFCDFFQQKKSDIVGKHIEFILHNFKEYIKYDYLLNLDFFEFEYKSRFYIVANNILKNNEGVKEGIVTIIRDVTAKKSLEINKQFIIQQSKLTEIGEMLSALTHQWKTPLVELSAVAHKLQYYNHKNRLTTQNVDEFFEIIMKQIIFMSDTMDGFRAFVKPSSKPVLFNINQGINEILNILKTSMQYNNIKIEYFNVLQKEIYIDGYPNEFKQVILNLINNAKDSILQDRTEHKKFGKIKIVLTQIEESVKIKIEDNGKGISDKVLNKIFNSFFTTKKKGDGIGLYMAKLIIENKMNGKIKAYNLKEGAKFIITLPKGEKKDENTTS